MKMAVFSTRPYDKRFLEEAKLRLREDSTAEFVYFEASLDLQTATLAQDCEAVCVFVNDQLDAPVLQALHAMGVRAVLLRCAGFNNIDLATAKALDLFVARVPAYSPEAVAEHTLALVMTLNRQTHRAYNRVREGNFMLNGLLGRTLHGKTVGLVGLGKIGLATARIFRGMGCRVLGYDPYPSSGFDELGERVELDTLFAQADIVTLHCPLTPATQHLIDDAALTSMKPGAMLVNTSRGGLVDTDAVIRALKSRQLGHLAIDVYEQESALFFQDLSGEIIDDDVFQRLMTFPNVLVTGHQGFFTAEALQEISEITLRNLADFAAGTACANLVAAP
ncbi:2-hydroxyacid dehydrogenase [Xanthomonas hortorum]|uniref:2-hydroxyacid dehydrogenase n=1 Tax=Xanthomonas hortorum TaxID=56454 RepID=UPI00062DAA5A|nr:2-hydroxyacid dehydrogenase [Xanthomonas hortorum]KLA99081.1 2-hydroxyacid dehydrogenase [Xanthomonas hortorum pv. gardneri]KLB03512.1 2-hydroxyacid dehydrogenase [Xanthomonas hortorum pv. gardneri]KLB07861.1 2-hydroxyacid dehydrogenase [Xanthomonas hortorum pv. gardneri]KLB13081.1 2-hydroxyacid dehydrogenase [Xanthomonas hortorum pv. gardneri]KLB20783.1 2-hydroxyacid dehydrogenase [Xanthomonas hortorum pv. gardneri]